MLPFEESVLKLFSNVSATICKIHKIIMSDHGRGQTLNGSMSCSLCNSLRFLHETLCNYKASEDNVQGKRIIMLLPLLMESCPFLFI